MFPPCTGWQPILLLGPFSAQRLALCAMEPGQPYQRDEALLEELGYKTGQKAMVVMADDRVSQKE